MEMVRWELILGDFMKCYDSIVKLIVRGVFSRSIVFLGKCLIAFLFYFLLDSNCFLQSERCTDYYLKTETKTKIPNSKEDPYHAKLKKSDLNPKWL